MANDKTTLCEKFLEECRAHIAQVQKDRGLSSFRSRLRRFFTRVFRRAENIKAEDTIESALPQIVADPMLVATPQKKVGGAILRAGMRHLPQHLHYFYRDPENTYEYVVFERIRGIHDVLHELVCFFVAGECQIESSRTILMLISEPGHAKTQTLDIIKRLLEQYKVPIIAGCPMNDLALWALPTQKKREIEERFGISLSNYNEPSDICASCSNRLVTEYAYDYLRLPVEWKSMKERFGSIGIFTSDPKDITQDSVEEFTGSIELGLSPLDPKAIESGALQIAQQGIMVLEELPRREPEMMHPLISASQSGQVQAPGRLGRNSVNVMVIATGNEEVYQEFLADLTNSPYKSRIHVIRFRRNLILSEEIEIVKQMLARSRKLYGKIHFPPASMDLIGRVLIASSLDGMREKKGGMELYNRIIDLYNGADPDALGFSEPAWRVREREDREKDGHLPSLSVRETKGIPDPVLAQLIIEHRMAENDAESDPSHICLPPFRVHGQITRYLRSLDRFDAKLVSALEEFALHTFYSITYPAIKERFVDISALEEECTRIFIQIKEGAMKKEVARLLQLGKDEYDEYIKSIERYDDLPELRRFIRTRALNKAKVSEEMVREQEKSEEWCAICIRDVLENLQRTSE